MQRLMRNKDKKFAWNDEAQVAFENINRELCEEAGKFVVKYRAYLGSAPFKLRVDNRWTVRLDGYHMIIEHRMRDKHQNADSLSKKTEFYERFGVETSQSGRKKGKILVSGQRKL